MERSKLSRFLAITTLMAGGALYWGTWGADRGEFDAPQTSEVTEPSLEETDTAAQLEPPAALALDVQATLSEEEALRGSLKSVSCFPELAGKDVLSTEEMTPTREGIQAMEGCLDLLGVRHPEEAAVELTTVFYLSPDGTVFETGVGADVGSLPAWDVLEPCAREYWLANPPKVRASDEKSFSCVYSWSAWSLVGGVHRVGAQVPSILAGRGSVAFGHSVTAPLTPP